MAALAASGRSRSSTPSIGATVITTGGSEDKLNYCRSIGADHAISYRSDWPAAVRKVAADGVHMILDNMGAKYLGDHVQLLATDGAVVIIGMQGGRKGTLDLASLMGAWPPHRELAARPIGRGEGSDLPRFGAERLATIADDTITQPPLTIFPWPRRPPRTRASSQVTTSARSSCLWRARPVSRFSAQGREGGWNWPHPAASFRTRLRMQRIGPFEAPPSPHKVHDEADPPPRDGHFSAESDEQGHAPTS